jgi:CRP-like cAMP-binding protein
MNRLLAALEPVDYDGLMAEAKVVSLKLNKVLYRQDQRIEAVFFPITCMVSILAGAGDTDLVETATVGNEGIVGAVGFIQVETAVGQHIIQLPGTAVRMEAGRFREQMNSRPALKILVERHAHALMRQVLYGAACNRVHNMEERCARWLLLTHDRAGTDTFPLTQEFLANMLAVRRATVNVATGMLKKAGFIRYVRGQMTIIDRPGLESASCDCYPAIWRAYNNAGLGR